MPVGETPSFGWAQSFSDIIDTMTFPKHSQFFEQGFDACEAGQPLMSCPYKQNTKEYGDWCKGWITAQQVKNDAQSPQG
jgi:ribosome modulation factor